MTVLRQPAVVSIPTARSGAAGRPAYGEDPRAVYVIVRQSIPPSVRAAAPGEYGVWVGGTFRTRVEAFVDDRYVGTLSRELTWPGNFLLAGDIPLAAGPARPADRLQRPRSPPGGDGTPGWGFGPFAIAKGTQSVPLAYLQPRMLDRCAARASTGSRP